MFVITIKFRVLWKSAINFVFPVFLEGVLVILDIRLLIALSACLIRFGLQCDSSL